jgi:peptidoglycan/xylan/chitin deacetylase (PgdA/CDA1 family)
LVHDRPPQRPIIPEAMHPHGLMFHHFHDERHPPGQGSISAAQLICIVERAGPERILPAREFHHRAMKGRLRPLDLCITFDDNLRCQYDVALPVLEHYGITAFWFAYTSVLQGNIEKLEIYRHFRMTGFSTVEHFYREFFDTVAASPDAQLVHMLLEEFNPRSYLTAFPFYSDMDRRFRFVRDEALGPQRYHRIMDQMLTDAGVDVKVVARNLWLDDRAICSLHGNGHVVGLHSHTHPTRLEHLTEDEQRDEYFQNYAYLSNLLHEGPTTMSHPCNSYNHTTLSILNELGISLGFRSHMSTSAASMLEFSREDHTNLLLAMAA